MTLEMGLGETFDPFLGSLEIYLLTSIFENLNLR